LLTDDEVGNLTIRKGTLNQKERETINNHALVTYKILSQLPFPKKLRSIPEYAASHHEIPAGEGYPRGLKGAQLSIQARILGLADVFEALTAKDRPYKKGKTLSEALTILESMIKERQIDPDLFLFLTEEGLHLDYARRELSRTQIDLPLPEEGV
jgi:HD-GYP domain-containing protein (c-di-GMP phosphodiesterase class II)